jgi:hypothetical protein
MFDASARPIASGCRLLLAPDTTPISQSWLHANCAPPSQNNPDSPLFSDHPRWSTREDRAEEAYDEALAPFGKFWSSPEASPGGRPPSMASLRNLQVADTKDGKAITAVVHIRHLKKPATLEVTLQDEKGRDSLRVLERTYLNDERSSTITAPLPKELLKRRKGKQFAWIRLQSGNETLYESTLIRLK